MPVKKVLILSILLFNVIQIFPQGAWGKEVFLNVVEKPLNYALNEIRKQTNINLIFSPDLTNEKLLTCNLNSTAEKVVSEILTKNGLSFKKFENNSVVIFKSKKSPIKFKAVVHESKLVTNFSNQNSELSKPTLLSKIDFEYPLLAINKRLEGVVQLNILINKQGNVSKVVVEKSSGHKILDSATINNVKKLKYLPAEYNGKYRDIWTTISFRYNFE